LADYSEHLDEFRAAGAELVAISVDDAARSETVRHEFGIKFPLLGDTGREVVKKYGLLNSGEKGGTRGVFPGLMFLRATMNALRHGVRSPIK
jgi:peroxiredoxin